MGLLLRLWLRLWARVGGVYGKITDRRNAPKV